MIGGPRQGIDQQLIRAVDAAAHKDLEEVLAGQPFAEEVSSASFDRRLKGIRVQQFREPLAEFHAARQIRKSSLRALLFGINPGARFGAVLVFEPSVGVSYNRAAIGVLFRIDSRPRRTLCCRRRDLGAGQASMPQTHGQKERSTQHQLRYARQFPGSAQNSVRCRPHRSSFAPGQADDTTECAGERGGSIVESSSAFWRDQNPGPWLRMAANNTRLANTPSFLREFKLSVLLLSVLLVLPCVWHRRIEAGDLASHVYNAWLAQLIEKGQAPGLYLVSRWNNVLFDITLLHLGKLFGYSVAEKIAVYDCVLIFFWGVFTFVAGVTARAPWFLAPCIAMLAYGYCFIVGFMNYYLSLGLACFGLALFWGARGREWIYGALLLPFVLLAHPIGFVWLIGTLAYVKVRARLTGWWKF